MMPQEEYLSKEEIAELIRLRSSYLTIPSDRILLGKNALSPSMRRAMALQVELYPKAQKKMPRFVADGGYFPARVNYEQASSEVASEYKAQLIGSKHCIVDLTGGLGMDFYALAQHAERGVYYEMDASLAEASRYNLFCLDNRTTSCQIEVYNEDSLEALARGIPHGCDLVLADPARRSVANPRRIHALEETIPSPRKILDVLHSQAYQGEFMFKLTPMADIKEIERVLPEVEELHLVVYQNELKEILVRGHLSEPLSEREERKMRYRIVELGLGETLSWECTSQEIATADLHPRVSLEVEEYIYIPNPALMKMGCFGYWAERFGIEAIGRGSHVFTSPDRVPSFPGRVYRKVEYVLFKKKLYKELIARYPAVSITARNFGMSADELRQRLKTQESDSNYLIATTDGAKNKILIVAESLAEKAE